MLFRKRGVNWSHEAVVKSRSDIRPELDGKGNMLYPCEEGFCEVRTSDLESWRPGQILPVRRHKMALARDASVVVRDRYGCVWAGNDPRTIYQCPGDPQPAVLPYGLARGGVEIIAQTSDGTMVIPTVGVVVIGRPGNFRAATIAHGYPNFGECLVTRDDNIWFGSAAGLWVLSSRWRMEYWTERDGVSGNPWSILPLATKTFALSGNDVQVLAEDRSRWLSLTHVSAGTHLMAGPSETILVSSRTEGVIQMSMTGRVLRRSAPSFVNMMARTPDGQRWSSGAKIAKIQIVKDRIDLQPETPDDPQNSGLDMKVGGDGSLWSCDAGGLVHRTPAGWQLLPRGTSALKAACNAFAIDRRGDIWFGTKSASLDL